MKRRFDAKVKTEGDLAALQLKGLKWTVNHVYKNSQHYRKKFDEAKVKPGDIKTLGDIRKLPFTSSKDLQAGYPFPLQSMPFEKIVRIHASSGTTGKRKVLRRPSPSNLIFSCTFTFRTSQIYFCPFLRPVSTKGGFVKRSLFAGKSG